MKEKLQKILKSKIFYIYLICILLTTFSTYQIASANGIGKKPLIILAELIIETGIFATYIALKRKRVPLEKVFLVFAIPLGLVFLIFLPPGESPDEINHFKRAYAITEGHFVSEVYDDTGHAGSELPDNIQLSLVRMPEKGAYATVTQKLSEPVSIEKSYTNYNNTSLYHWACYLPQVVGIFLGRLFGASFEVMAYLAEIVDFIIWAILIYFAIKLIPKFKSIILFVSLLPITLQEATSLAPDALAIGLGIFLISFVCYLTYTKKSQLSVKEIILLYLLAIMIDYCKIVYLPFVLLYLIIPSERFGSKRAKWIHAAVLGVLLLILNLTWLSTSSQFLMEFNEGVNTSEQVAGILRNPIRYVAVLFSSLNQNGGFYLTSMLGINLGSFSFNLPTIFTYLSFAIFILLFAQRHDSLKIKPFERAIFAATFLIIFLLIFTSIYVQWSPVGLPYVDGVQGRYFLPILLLIPIAIVSSKPRSPQTEIVSADTIFCYGLTTNLIAIALFFCQNL